MSDQLHALAALSQEKEPPGPTEYEAVWATYKIKKNKSFDLRQKSNHPVA
jgi:hypothetical protein